MSQQPFPRARTTELNVQTIGDETLVFDRTTDKAFVLNLTAAAVWKAANGQRTIKDIATYLSNETPTDEQTVSYALGQMQELLQAPIEIPDDLQGISRRQFLRRAGFVAAAAVVPVVVSMVAPSPAHAASGPPP